MKKITNFQTVEPEGSTLLIPEPQLDTNLSQVHPLHILIIYFALIHFNVSFQSRVALIPENHITNAHMRIEAATGIHWIGGWVDPRIDVQKIAKRKIFSHVVNQTAVVQPIASFFILIELSQFTTKMCAGM
jgi:hypothetical protein